MDFGPTHLIPGSHYNRGLTKDGWLGAVAGSGKAGTTYMAHFDIAHGAGVNQRQDRRFMLKFVAMRREEPVQPSWNHRESDWLLPDGVETQESNEILWTHIWDWIRGHDDPLASWKKINGTSDQHTSADLIKRITQEPDPDLKAKVIQELASERHASADAVSCLLNCLNDGPAIVRNNATYALAALAPASTGPLIERLEGAVISDAPPGMMSGGSGWGNPNVMTDETFALIAIGKDAVPALIELLNHENEWTRINAAFALGEIGAAPEITMPALAKALKDPSWKVIRTALDAVGTVPGDPGPALPAMTKIILSKAKKRELQDSRVNAAAAFARLGNRAEAATDALIQALANPDFNVRFYAALTLTRMDNNPTANEAVDSLLISSSWNPDNPAGTGESY